MSVTRFDRFRYWLIKKLAGDRFVLLNTSVRGPLVVRHGQRGMACHSTIDCMGGPAFEFEDAPAHHIWFHDEIWINGGEGPSFRPGAPEETRDGD